VASPRIVSSSPADLQIVGPATLGITIHFNETMTPGVFQVRYGEMRTRPITGRRIEKLFLLQ
jgi:hypothetical protein